MPSVQNDSVQDPESRLASVLSERWRLERLLGVGGMGAVYEAVHLNNGSRAAIKLLHLEFAQNADVKRRFQREGYLANKVGHPDVVRVLDDGIAEDGAPYIVMELLSGVSLREKAIDAPEPFPHLELLNVAHSVLDVLAAAHEAGVIHRDLKPDNIFLTNDGRVKLVDFGVARTIDVSHEKTRVGQVVGTPEYMPPEQARGRSELIDGRSDLWALGAVLFRIVTGRPARQAETVNEMLLSAMTEPVPKVRSLVPTLDPKLADLIDVALDFDKARRFEDARAMQRALEVARASILADGKRSTDPSLSGNVESPATSGVRDTEVVSGGPLWLHNAAKEADSPLRLSQRRRRRGFLMLCAVLFGAGVGIPLAFMKPGMQTLRSEIRTAATNIVNFGGADLELDGSTQGSSASDAGASDNDLGSDERPDAGANGTSATHATKPPVKVAAHPAPPKRPPVRPSPPKPPPPKRR